MELDGGPEWFLGNPRPARTPADDGPAQRGKKEATTAVVGQAAAASSKKGTDLLKELVLVLTRLSLSNSRELAEITGTVFTTYLVPLEAPLVASGLAAGVAYNEAAKDLKAKQEAGEEGIDLAGLGPPHLHVFVAVLRTMAEQKLSEEDAKVVKDYWDEVVCKTPMLELGSEIKYFRVKTLKEQEQQSKKVAMAKVQFAVDVVHVPAMQALETVLMRMIESMQGQRKYGAAPRGPLEREASRLLDRLSRA